MSDVMLIGVLRMPIPDNPDPITLRQFVDRARQAADRIESDAEEIARLRMELENTRAEAVLGMKAAAAAERERFKSLPCATCEALARTVMMDQVGKA